MSDKETIEVKVADRNKTRTPHVLVYLAGPIASVGRDVAMQWRKLASEFLSMMMRVHSVSIFDPAAAFNLTDAARGDEDLIIRIQAIDNVALLASNVVLAQYIDGVESVGTDIELKLACKNNIPVILWGSSVQDTKGHLLQIGWHPDAIEETIIVERLEEALLAMVLFLTKYFSAPDEDLALSIPYLVKIGCRTTPSTGTADPGTTMASANRPGVDIHAG